MRAGSRRCLLVRRGAWLFAADDHRSHVGVMRVERLAVAQEHAFAEDVSFPFDEVDGGRIVERGVIDLSRV